MIHFFHFLCINFSTAHNQFSGPRFFFLKEGNQRGNHVNFSIKIPKKYHKIFRINRHHFVPITILGKSEVLIEKYPHFAAPVIKFDLIPNSAPTLN